MTLRKSDLYGSLWKSCDELRGGMDASQYKEERRQLEALQRLPDDLVNEHRERGGQPPSGSGASALDSRARGAVWRVGRCRLSR